MELTIQKMTTMVAKQRRDEAYQAVLQAQRELKRLDYEYQEFLDNAGDTITITWHIADVRSLAYDIDVTDDQCREVLRRVARYHDVSIGINWDVISHHLGKVLLGEGL